MPRCPFCREQIEDDLWTCPSCHTPHHGGCATENGHCTVFGCTWTFGEAGTQVAPTLAAPVLEPPSVTVCPHCREAATSEIWVCTQCYTVQHRNCAERRNKCGRLTCNETFVPRTVPQVELHNWWFGLGR